MFNVTIIKLKDLIKYLLALVIIIMIIFGVKRFFFDENNKKIDKYNKESEFKLENMLLPLNTTIPVINHVNNTENNQKNMEDSDSDFISKTFRYVLGTELELINYVSKMDVKDKEDINIAKDTNDDEMNRNEDSKENEDNIENNGENKEKTDDETKNLNENVNTEVITQNPLKDNVTNSFRGVKIKNETDFELTDEILRFDDINVDKSNIIIFHTHTCESYTSSEKYSYIPTGNYRTTDLNYSVVRVGDELTNCLNSYGINVIHNKTFHDYPAYTGSYSRSFSTVSNILKDKKADIIIDLHRDAIGNYSSYAPTVKIGEEYCAQLMFVMGTNGGGLYHPNWQNNLKWAVSIQDKANNMYPGLFKTMIVRNSRYNQNLGKAACIIEVGATGNTLEQCINSMKYLAEIINK